jgi:TolA-binding protein
MSISKSIVQLHKCDKKLCDKITTLENEIQPLQNQITTLENEIQPLQNQITTLENEIQPPNIETFDVIFGGNQPSGFMAGNGANLVVNGNGDSNIELPWIPPTDTIYYTGRHCVIPFDS